MLGYEPNEFDANFENWLQLIHPDDRERAVGVAQEYLKTKPDVYENKFRLRTKTGEYRWIRAHARVVDRDADGNALYMIGNHEDVTEGMAARESLIESEELFRTVFEQSAVGVAQVRPDGRFARVNTKFCEISGYSPEELRQRTVGDISHPDDMSIDNKYVAQVMKGERDSFDIEKRYVRKDGGVVWIKLFSNVVRDANGDVKYAIATIADITEARDSAERIRESEVKFRALVDNTVDWVWQVDTSGRYTYVSPNVGRIIGYSPEELLGKTPFDLMQPEEALRIGQAFAEIAGRREPIIALEDMMMHKDGRLVIFETNATPVFDGKEAFFGYFGICRDITEGKRAEEALRNTERLESLGILAGGIAHDFNNLLGGVFGYIDMAREVLGRESVALAREYLEKACEAMDRARNLTQQFLTFTRGGGPTVRAARVEPLIANAAGMALSGSAIGCRYDIDEGLWSAVVDENQIGQVINNIVINARQAMASKGEIRVSARNRDIKDEEQEAVVPGTYVEVVIADSGPGIRPETIGRIFDPFYTTKEKGSGLGLATSYSIVKRHRGHLWVESEPGAGAKFTILLPALPEEKDSAGPGFAKAISGSGRVLVLDDVPLIAEMAADMLRGLGYEVRTYASGAEAVRAYQAARETGTPFDAAVLDLTVPGEMGGEEVMEKLRAIDPKVKALVSSGYADSPVMSRYREYGFGGAVVKPYRTRELAWAMHDLLSGRDQEG
ncbi:MAG: PAS domain S-box protein [Chitinivibrionales bacterium]|nr:PAS domain S-box protein [Chitinivibrionales bacterium]MBD3396114.1 PAS domain S-box protein [Chitinivibrionales bacterium]